jgi:hypothetical protein
MRSWIGLLAALTLACGDDAAPSGETGEGTGSSTDSSTSTTDASTSTTDASASGSGDSSTGMLPTEVDVSGIHEDFFSMVPIVGAEISVLDLPGFETTSADDGSFTFSGLPADSFQRILVADSTEYWGSVVPLSLEHENIDDQDLSQVSLEVIDIQQTELQKQDPDVMVDETKAAFLIALIQNTATGAVVEVDPPPPEGTYYAPNDAGQPILNQNEIQWGLFPVAVVFNLEPGPAGTYEITVTHPQRECTVEDPEPPTFARHINLVRVDCPPPG